MSGNTLKVETDERVLLSTEKQENKDGKIRTFLHNLSFLSQVVLFFCFFHREEVHDLCGTVVNIGL